MELIYFKITNIIYCVQLLKPILNLDVILIYWVMHIQYSFALFIGDNNLGSKSVAKP